MPTPRYLIAVRYDQYEAEFYTYYSRVEALAKYAKIAKSGSEVWFCNIPKKLPEVKP